MALIYEYDDYKRYILDKLASVGSNGRGGKAKLAVALNCQPAFVSQVLNGNPDFSLEQALRVNSFFRHDGFESQYFMLLVQKMRAGSKELSGFFENQINKMRKKRYSLAQRLEASNIIDEKVQAQYYSSWHYAAVHILTSIPQFSSAEKIAQSLGLSIEKTKMILNFLIEAAIVQEVADGFKVGVTRTHLSGESPLVLRHHQNWRSRAMASIDENSNEDLHYSLVFSISSENKPKVKEICIKAIQDIRVLIRESKDEEAVALTIDFFNLTSI